MTPTVTPADYALRMLDGEMLKEWNYPPEAGALCVCGHALQLHGYYPRNCHYCACEQFKNAEPADPEPQSGWLIIAVCALVLAWCVVAPWWKS